jgi:hypothetical protein
MKLLIKEHTVPKKTQWGTVEKSLNQHIVFIENDETKQMMQCGYVGATAFLPLAGFPQELCEEVAAECSKQLGKPVSAGQAPPSLNKLAEMIAEQNKSNEPDDETEDDE